jgi:hypothetical protein
VAFEYNKKRLFSLLNIEGKRNKDENKDFDNVVCPRERGGAGTETGCLGETNGLYGK